MAKDTRPMELQLSPPALTTDKLDCNRLLDTIANYLSAILKVCLLTLVLILFISILINVYNERGVIILPFEICENEHFNGIAIADQLTSELIWIQSVHNNNYEFLAIKSEGGITYYPKIFSEDSLGNHELIVPKAETLEFCMADVGTIGLGSNSLSVGNLVIAFKNIMPGSKSIRTMRGSLQRYGSDIVIVAVLEGSDIQSWTIRKTIDNNNEEDLHEMIKNLAFMIAHDLPQSGVSANTWKGLKYYTESLDAYHQYKLSGNLDALYLACNYSLAAISSEKDFKNSFRLLHTLELHLLSTGKQSDAIEYCNRALELNPTSACAWNIKGSILQYLGKYDEAIQAYDVAIKLDSEYASPWYNKGLTLRILGNYDGAIQAYDMAIKLDPADAYAWNGKGNALYYQNMYEEAILAYDEAIQLDPEHTYALVNKGNALFFQGKYKKAIRAYDEAIRLNSEDAWTWYNKGATLYHQGKYDEAIQAYDEAIRLDPEYALEYTAVQYSAVR